MAGLRQRRDQRLLIACDVRTAEHRVVIRREIARLRRIDLIPLEALRPQNWAARHVREQTHQIIREIPVIPCDQQLPQCISLSDALRVVGELLGEDGLMDKLRVLLQQLRPPPSVVRVIRRSAEQAAGEIAEPCLLIRHQIVIGGLGRLREPLARIVLRGVIPAERQIRRAKLLLGDGERDQKLIVQIDRALLLRLVPTRHIQRVIVLPAALQIFRPGQSVFGHPSEALEHALGENEIHIVDPVALSPDVCDLRDFKLVEQALVVHLMDNALDVRQTDLKRMMFFLITAEQRRQLIRHQTLAIELQHLDVHLILDAAIGAHRIRRAVIRHGNDRHIPHQRFRIVDDDDAPGVQKVLALDPVAVGEHQGVIGIELG